MPHQCVHCGKIYDDTSERLLKGCTCGSNFFFFIREGQLKKLKKENQEIKLEKVDKEQMEKEVREIAGIHDESIPVILDIESVRIVKPGKFEIDLVNLFNKKRPLIYKLEKGKYIIDLASSLNAQTKELEKRKV